MAPRLNAPIDGGVCLVLVSAYGEERNRGDALLGLRELEQKSRGEKNKNLLLEFSSVRGARPPPRQRALTLLLI